MTREEAIKTIRLTCPKISDSECDFETAMRFLIPELRESEDERIRKWLIEQMEIFHNQAEEVDSKENIELTAKAITYLEKQKENPKSADSIPSDCVSSAKCEDRWHKVGDSLPDNPREVLCKDEAGNYFIGRYYVGEGWEISNYDDEDKPHHLNPPVSKWIDFPPEKQKEQKPAEKPKWDDSDMREDESELQTRFAFYTYKDDSTVLYLSNVFVEEASRNHGFGTRILMAAEKVAETIGATTICLKVKQDSPANAWYRKNGYGYVAFEDGYDWLEKNLEYMKPVKSAEWSEEDEKIAYTILNLLCSQVTYVTGQGTTSGKQYPTYSKERDWFEKRFKSLRPVKQEWNEEDEMMLASIISTIKLTNGAAQMKIDWLENRVKSSLNPPPKIPEQKPVKHPKMVEMLREHLENTPKEQLDVEFEELKNWNDVGPTVEEFFHGKPIEWNEKDEKMRACAISLLQISRDSGMAINPGFGKPVRAINKCIDWLKSLRPSWKPSEEDIKMLEHIIGQYETGNKNSKVMGYLPRVEELSFLKKVLSKWKN